MQTWDSGGRLRGNRYVGPRATQTGGSCWPAAGAARAPPHNPVPVPPAATLCPGQENLTESRAAARQFSRHAGGRSRQYGATAGRGRPPATPCRTVFNVKRRAWSQERAAGGSGKWAQTTYPQSRPRKSYQFSRRVRRGRPWRQTGAAGRRLPPAGPFLTLKGARGAKSGRQGVAASGRQQL